jgi:hypothetical protein
MAKPGHTIVVFDGDTAPFVLRGVTLEEDSVDLRDEGNIKKQFFLTSNAS